MENWKPEEIIGLLQEAYDFSNEYPNANVIAFQFSYLKVQYYV